METPANSGSYDVHLINAGGDPTVVAKVTGGGAGLIVGEGQNLFLYRA